MYCPNCGTRLSQDAKYCDNCRILLPTSSPQFVQQPEPSYTQPMAYPQPAPYMPPEEKRIHTASLVLSIIGLAFSLILPIVTYPCSIVGLVFAINRKTKNKTTAAFVMCIVGLGLAVIRTIVNLALLSSFMRLWY